MNKKEAIEVTLWNEWKEFPPCKKLDSIRKLSLRFKVSTRLIQEVIHSLVSKNKIESRPKSGIWTMGTPIPPTEKIISSTLDIFGKIKNDLLLGIYPWDSPLPLIKEWSNQYYCHPQTMSKVISILIEQNLIFREGRFHYLVRPTSKKSTILTPTILCIGAIAPDGNFRMDISRESDFWRDLGAQASLSGLGLKRIAWNGGEIKTDKNTVGIIASTWHYENPMAICKELIKSKLPTCIWVEEHILGEISQKTKLHFHDQGYSSEIGSAIAKHLLLLNHKNISFISPWHGSQWSKNRYKGIENEIQNINGTINLFALENESEWDWLIPAQNDVNLLNGKHNQLLESLLEGAPQNIIAAIKLEKGWNRIYQDLIPLFEKALESQSTAWVLSNDPCALFAMKWLQTQGIRVPEDISIAGFDDSVEGLRADLTTYNFSCSAMARSMIYQILTPYNKKFLTTHKGIVVPRKSTTQAKF